MKMNAGTIDRILRVLIGIGLLSLALTGPKTAFGYIGIIPVLTGLFGYCPVYTVLGVNTCSMKKG
jgi:hypothetical protein